MTRFRDILSAARQALRGLALVARVRGKRTNIALALPAPERRSDKANSACELVRMLAWGSLKRHEPRPTGPTTSHGGERRIAGDDSFVSRESATLPAPVQHTPAKIAAGPVTTKKAATKKAATKKIERGAAPRKATRKGATGKTSRTGKPGRKIARKRAAVVTARAEPSDKPAATKKPEAATVDPSPNPSPSETRLREDLASYRLKAGRAGHDGSAAPVEIPDGAINRVTERPSQDHRNARKPTTAQGVRA